MLNGGELEGRRFLDEDLVAAMRTNQNPRLEAVDGDTGGCGYGPQFDEFLDDTVIWHTRTTSKISRAYAGFLPERDLGAILGTNTGAVPMEVLGKGVLAIVAGEDLVEVVPFLALRRKTRAVVGTYEGFRDRMTMTVKPAETMAGLDVTCDGGRGATFTASPELTALDDYTFYVVRENGIRIALTFKDADKGMEFRFGSNRLYRTSRDTDRRSGEQDR